MSAEKKEPDPPQKIIEPPERGSIVTKDVSKDAVKKPEQEKNLRKESPLRDQQRKDKILLIAGIPLVVLVAIAAEYLYRNFYVIPLQERTLLNVVNIDIKQAPWIARTNGSRFSLIHNTELLFEFEYFNRDSDKLEFVWNKGNEKFGSLMLNDSQLEAKFVLSDSSWDLSLFLISAAYEGKRLLVHPNLELTSVSNYFTGKSKLGEIRVTGLELSEREVFEVALTPGQEILISLRDATSTENANNFSERFSSLEKAYDTQFEEVFQLKAKAMPEFYQNMGKAALSLVLSSLYTEERVFSATGAYNSLFKISKLSFTHLHLPEGCEDLRTQGLAALAIIDLQPDAVLQVITSWTNLVNSYGAIPTNVSGTLDYKNKLAPALFVLLDEYIQKNGVTSLKPIYQNVEKLGHSLIELKNNDYLFAATQESFFFEPVGVSSGQLYTVELNAIMIKASRVLKTLSEHFGTPEVAKKFADFNEAADNIDNLSKFLTEEGDHSDFVLHKEENSKEFITSRVSMAPLIFQLFAPASKELQVILQKLGDPEIFWTNYGISSSEGVSVPQNYMILKALHYYSQQSGPNQDVAHALYARLRNHLIMFVAQEFKKTKTFWETISSVDGRGQGRKDWLPSATILKIMAEMY